MSSSAVNRSSVHLAVVMPHSFFNGKEYQKKMYAAANGLARLEFTVGACFLFYSLGLAIVSGCKLTKGTQ